MDRLTLRIRLHPAAIRRHLLGIRRTDTLLSLVTRRRPTLTAILRLPRTHLLLTDRLRTSLVQG